MKLRRILTIRKADFTLDLLGKFIIVFLFTGVVLTPIMWLTGLPLLQSVAQFTWDFGKVVCSDTGRSVTLGGLPLMVCARCFGVVSGMLLIGLLYFYTPLIRPLISAKRLYIASLIAALFLPWLIDSGLERFGPWQTFPALMFVTGFLAGTSLIIAPRLFWPSNPLDDDKDDKAEELDLYPASYPSSQPELAPASSAKR